MTTSCRMREGRHAAVRKSAWKHLLSAGRDATIQDLRAAATTPPWIPRSSLAARMARHAAQVITRKGGRPARMSDPEVAFGLRYEGPAQRSFFVPECFSAR